MAALNQYNDMVLDDELRAYYDKKALARFDLDNIILASFFDYKRRPQAASLFFNYMISEAKKYSDKVSQYRRYKALFSIWYDYCTSAPISEIKSVNEVLHYS